MISKPIDEIEKEDIDSLITNSVAENRVIEYKDSLPGNGDEDKREFLADVSAFANSAGGDLIYGIQEKDGIAISASGAVVLNRDGETLRLENIIRDGLGPRITGIRIQWVDGFPNGSVLVIRIPKSWASPHMVVFKNASRFYSRNNAGKHQMDVAEIRSSFLLSETIPERIRSFRLDRLSRIMTDEAPISLGTLPKVVLHLVPLAAFGSETRLSPADLRNQGNLLRPLDNSASSSRFNIDGWLAASPEPPAPEYSLIFRNSVIESVGASRLICDFDKPNRKVIASQIFEEKIWEAVGRYLNAYRKFNVSPPCFVMLSLLGCKGYVMAQPGGSHTVRSTSIDRDVLALPEHVVDDFSLSATKIMQPVFDMIWNAAGQEKSPYYDAEGNRKQG